MTDPKPLPKRALRIVRSRASSFKWEYPLLSLRLFSGFLHLLPRLPVTSIPPFIFPSITRCRRQFPRKMWPIQLAFFLFISCRIFLCSLNLSNTLVKIFATFHETYNVTMAFNKSNHILYLSHKSTVRALTSTPMSLKWSFSFRFSHQNPVGTSFTYMPLDPPILMFWGYYPNNQLHMINIPCINKWI